MATGKPNERGDFDRPPPDDALWTEDAPVVSRKTPPSVPKPPAPAKPAGGQASQSKPPAGQRRPARPATSGVAALEAAIGSSPNVERISPLDPEAEDEGNLDILWGLVQNAPAWLISAVVHTSLLIILGLFLAVGARKTHLISPGINLSEPQSDALEDGGLSDVGPGTQLIDKNASSSEVLTPQAAPAAGDSSPFATPPALSDIRLGGSMPAVVGNIGSPNIGLSLHGREGGMKNALLGIYGGTGGTESAVGRGLEWVVKQQRSDGLWSLSGPYTKAAAQENIPAATAMALLAIQGAGVTPSKGKYAKQVDKGWTALLKLQDKDGSFMRGCPNHQGTYAHAQCTIALCEVLSMTRDPRFYEPAQRAISFCIAQQDKKLGGWRYETPPDSDTSATGWFIMALKSGEMAGIEVPQEVWYEAMRYLDAAAMNDSRYAYTPSSFSTPAVTAEAYLCRQLMGWKQDDPRLLDGCKFILTKLPTYTAGEQRDVYFWYYATQVCHHMEGDIWSTWNNVMREELPAHQVKDGPEYGSWDPDGDRWSQIGRLYTTCLSVYMLEVYYRHLPIYSAYKYNAK